MHGRGDNIARNNQFLGAAVFEGYLNVFLEKTRAAFGLVGCGDAAFFVLLYRICRKRRNGATATRLYLFYRELILTFVFIHNR